MPEQSIREFMFAEAECPHRDRPTYAHGLCVSCYNKTLGMARRREQGRPIQPDLHPDVAAALDAKVCLHPDRPRKARGLCESCYVATRAKAMKALKQTQKPPASS